MIYTVTIPANDKRQEKVEASVFACIEADGLFSVKLGSGGQAQEMKPGRNVGTPAAQGGKVYHQITFINDTGAPVIVKFYAGVDAFQNDPPQVNGAVVATLVSGGETAVTPNEGIYLIEADDTIEQIWSSATYYRQLLLYPAKAVVNGVLTANTLGNIYLGRSALHLPEVRATTDVAYPVIFDCPPGQRMLISTIRIRGKLGDGVFYSFI